MELTRNQKIAIGVGAGILIGCVIYFGFIRKADEVAEAVSDPAMSGGTSGGQGGSPAGAPPSRGNKPATSIAGKEGAILASQGRG